MPVSRADTAELDNNSIQDVLIKIRQETIDELVRSLENVDRVSSGVLSQSIEVDLPEDGKGGISFILSMEDYWKFVDEGVNGTKNSRGSQFGYKKKNIKQAAVKEFIANRGIGLGDLATHYTNKKGLRVPRKTKLPAEKARNTLAWLIGRSISEKGTAPTNFYSDVITDEWKKDFTKRVAVALGEDIAIAFKDIQST